MALTKDQLENAVDLELTAWIVVADNYEYNDEYYYFTEGGYELDQVFFDKDKAIRRAQECQADWSAQQEEDMWNDGIPEERFHVVPITVRN